MGALATGTLATGTFIVRLMTYALSRSHRTVLTEPDRYARVPHGALT
jgi:hypothetical protein